MLITPPAMQFSVELLFKAGWLVSMTVGEPGDQGMGVLGRQGPGVGVPSAAAVAAAVAGLPWDMHGPNGLMFTIGTWSMMLAAGWLKVLTILAGSTARAPGAGHIEHLMTALLHTWLGMAFLRVRCA